MVYIEVGTDFGVDARGALALSADVEVATAHAIHIGRWAAQVGEIAFEVGHFDDLPHFAQDAFFRAAHDKLALVGGNGTERAASETASVHIDGELDHFVGRYLLALVLRMRQSGVREVETAIDLLGGHRGEGWIDHGIARVVGFFHAYTFPLADALEDALRFELIALLLNMAKVGRVEFAVAHTLFVGVEHDIVGADATVDVLLVFERNGLEDGIFTEQLAEIFGCCKQFLLVVGEFLLYEPAQSCQRKFAHAIDEQVGATLLQDAGAQGLLPIVVVGDAPQGGLDASQHHGHIGIELFENVGVDDARHFRSHVVTSIGAVSVFRTQATGSGVAIHHRVHISRRDAEEKAWAAEALEVAIVAVPRGLGHNANAKPFGFKQSSNDCCSKGRVVDIGIAGEKNDVGLCPTAKLHFALRSGEPVGELWHKKRKSGSLPFAVLAREWL